MTAEIIAAKRRKIIKRFISAGAISAQTAQSKEELRLHNRLLWARLLKSGVIVESKGKFYLDKKRLEEVQERRKRMLIPLVIGLVLLFFTLFYLLK